MYALFSRAGFTEAADQEIETAVYVDLATIDTDLARGMNASRHLDDLPI